MKLTFASFVADSTSHNANFAKATAMLTQAEEFSRDGVNQEEAGPRTMKCGEKLLKQTLFMCMFMPYR